MAESTEKADSTDIAESSEVNSYASDTDSFWQPVPPEHVWRPSTNGLGEAIIEKFMKRYEDGLYCDYIEVSRQGAHTISEKLDANGIKHEIFHRGKAGLMREGQTDLAASKSLDSTRKTILRRLYARIDRGEGLYEKQSQIVSEMHDLAGIRVAIYYPSDFEKVENLIRYHFQETSTPQDWPDRDYGPYSYSLLDRSSSAMRDITGRHSRFPGYFSRHFRVQLRKTAVSPGGLWNWDDSWGLSDFWDRDDVKGWDEVKNKNDAKQEDNVKHEDDVKDRYNVKGKTLEIQVMSILMHSWSMVNQELVYKPKVSSGAVVRGPEVDEDDQRLLDIANGIVIAGEQVLRQLQMNLDSKTRRKQYPERRLWGDNEFKSYLNDKWVLHGDMYGLSRSFITALRLAIETQERMQSLFDSWRSLGTVDDKRIDRRFEGAIQLWMKIPVHFREDASVDTVLDLLFISTVRRHGFVTVETNRRRKVPARMKLIQANDLWNIARNRNNALQYVRYEALIVCNAMRLFAPRCNDYGEFKSHIESWGSHNAPIWAVFGRIIHPVITQNADPVELLQTHRFCNDLIYSRRDHRWESYCARGRLGIVHWMQAVTVNFPAMCSICPAFFVQYLLGLSTAQANTSTHHNNSYYKPVAKTNANWSGWEVFEGKHPHVRFLEDGLERQHLRAIEDSEASHPLRDRR